MSIQDPISHYAALMHQMRTKIAGIEHDFLCRLGSLTIQNWRVLWQAAAYPESTMGQLAKAFPRLSLSTMTAIVDKLVAQEYLLRERSLEDRRVVCVKLAEKGQAVLSAYQESTQAVCALALNRLTALEQHTFLTLYQRIVDEIDSCVTT